MKKIRILLAMLGICILVVGCSPAKSPVEKSAGSEASVSETEEKSSEDNKKNVEKEDGEDEASEDTSVGESNTEAYEAFLLGEGRLSADYYKENRKIDEKYPSDTDDIMKALVNSGKDYTITEFKDELNTIFNSKDNFIQEGEVCAIRYAYIDCGNDGVKELALKVIGPNPNEYENTFNFIIKEINGNLEIIHVYETWSRNDTAINEYGLISGGGSNSYSNHGYEESYINEDGEYLYGYYEEEELDVESFGDYEERENIDFTGLDKAICVYSLRLEDYNPSNPPKEYYAYRVCDKESFEPIDVQNLYTDSEYKNVMDQFIKHKFISYDELKARENEKMKFIGVTDEIRNGDLPEYKDIELEGLPISSTDDDSDEDDDITAADGDIQSEMTKVEKKHQEYENMDWGSMNQADMNITTGEMYELWDAELNSLWSRLMEEAASDSKEKLLKDQREWIKRKEAEVKAAGEEALGGSLQPQLENGKAWTLTRKRSYEIASILAETLGEDFEIPSKVKESFEGVELSLDDVFKKFEGQWIFDKDRGACIGIEKSSENDFAPEGSKWTVWVTGGDVLSDLDVTDYTDGTISFHKKSGSIDGYYMLRFNMEGSVEMAYGTSPDKMDELTVAY